MRGHLSGLVGGEVPQLDLLVAAGHEHLAAVVMPTHIQDRALYNTTDGMDVVTVSIDGTYLHGLLRLGDRLAHVVNLPASALNVPIIQGAPKNIRFFGTQKIRHFVFGN